MRGVKAGSDARPLLRGYLTTAGVSVFAAVILVAASSHQVFRRRLPRPA